MTDKFKHPSLSDGVEEDWGPVVDESLLLILETDITQIFANQRNDSYSQNLISFPFYGKSSWAHFIWERTKTNFTVQHNLYKMYSQSDIAKIIRADGAFDVTEGQSNSRVQLFQVLLS